MKECQVIKVNFEAESAYDYQVKELNNAINAMLTKGWCLRKTHYCRYHALLTFMRDVKLRVLE